MVTERGYQERDYLDDPYLSGEISLEAGIQANMIIQKQETFGLQAEMVIADEDAIGLQGEMIIDAENAIGIQANLQLASVEEPIGIQANMSIAEETAYGLQAEMMLYAESVFGIQAEMNIVDRDFPVGIQAEMSVGDSPSLGIQATFDTLRHAMCDEVYLYGPYLEGPYFIDCMKAFVGIQALQSLRVQDDFGLQANQFIGSSPSTGIQARMIINDDRAYGIQATMMKRESYGLQMTMVIYNATQLRVLCDFPSRGVTSGNWVSDPIAASGDFGTDNLNTDIVEQVYKSTTATLVNLTCDTGLPQGVPVDTIAILNHNFTRSATVQVQGSKDNFATPPDITFDMTVETENMYWIAPSLPNVAGQNRYWRFVIQDITNPAGYLTIGTIIFGAANMFSVAESFTNPIVWGQRHFKDQLQTEGFTTDSNDRALKKFLRLKFGQLNYFMGNYGMLRDMMSYARTSLKCLVIPTPEYPSRFAVFAKLTALPEITFNDLEERLSYMDFDLEWDESA